MTDPAAAADAVVQDEPFAPGAVRSETAWAGRIWDINEDHVRYNGHEIVRQYVHHPGAASIVALDAHDRVLLIQQYRHPIRHRDWELPAGLLDHEGESPLETARRELAEEVDYDAATWEPLVDVWPSPGGNDEVVHVFLARDLTARTEAFERDAEEADIRMQWVPLTDAVDAVLAGRVRNGILALGLLAAAEHRRRSG